MKLLYVFEVVDKKNAFIVTNNKKVFAIGSYDYGVLGLSNKYIENELKFNKHLSDKRIVDFINGYYHVMAHTIDGRVYC
jgi:alpha-tubulin suppressor-like RCC1 family protein